MKSSDDAGAVISEIKRQFVDLDAHYRNNSQIISISIDSSKRSYVNGERIEAYFDVELINNHALVAWIEIQYVEGCWEIDSRIQKITEDGEDTVVEMPKREALDDELETEVVRATSALVNAFQRVDIGTI